MHMLSASSGLRRECLDHVLIYGGHLRRTLTLYSDYYNESRTQDEKILIEFSTEHLAGLGINRADVIAALRAQNAVSPAGTLQTGDETLALRVSGAFQS